MTHRRVAQVCRPTAEQPWRYAAEGRARAHPAMSLPHPFVDLLGGQTAEPPTPIGDDPGDVQNLGEPVGYLDDAWGQASGDDPIPLGDVPEHVPISDISAAPVVEELDPDRTAT